MTSMVDLANRGSRDEIEYYEETRVNWFVYLWNRTRNFTSQELL